MRNKYILLSLFTIFLMAGCVSDVNDTGTAGYPFSVQSVTINGVATRASSPLSVDGATIGVSTLADGAVAASSAYTYSTSTAKWAKASGSSDLFPKDASYLCAYYPYSASITNKAAIPLASAVYATAADLSYAYSGVVIENSSTGTSNATFVLQHAYSRLTFNFSHDSDYTLSKAVNSVTISNPGILTSGSLNITKPVAVFTNKVASDVTFNTGITDIDATPQLSVLMVPTDVLSGNIALQIQVGADYKVLSLPMSLFANSKLEAGVNYSISVKLTNTGALDLGTGTDKYITIADWTTPDAVNTAAIDIQPESNCYIVAPGSTILIPVSRATTCNAANFSSGSSFTCGLLWSDVSATHVTATSEGRYIKVAAGSTEGNAVIYAKNTANEIVWSWHIWVTDYNPSTTNMSYNSKVWMDRNIGAKTNDTSTLAYGVYYQWGRKDPFPGSTNNSSLPVTYGSAPVTSGAGSVTLATSISNPNVFYIKSSGNYDWLSATDQTNLWYNSGKTPYDPCPDGWRVPLSTEFKSGTSFTSSNVLGGYYRYDAAFLTAATSGWWWTANSVSDRASFFDNAGAIATNSYRVSARTVRCVKQ